MTKAQLVADIATKCGCSKRAAGEFLDAFASTVIFTMKSSDDPIRITGFGTFKLKHRKARTGHNPATGEDLDIHAKAVPTFLFAKSVRDVVNEAHNRPRRR